MELETPQNKGELRVFDILTVIIVVVGLVLVFSFVLAGAQARTLAHAVRAIEIFDINESVREVGEGWEVGGELVVETTHDYYAEFYKAFAESAVVDIAITSEVGEVRRVGAATAGRVLGAMIGNWDDRNNRRDKPDAAVPTQESEPVGAGGVDYQSAYDVYPAYVIVSSPPLDFQDLFFKVKTLTTQFVP